MRTCVRVSLFGAVCSDSVTVSGAEAVQLARMGTYLKVAGLVQGGSRPVYQRVGSTVVYLYYWPGLSSWYIGSNYTSGSVGVKSISGAVCPYQATGWQAYTGGVWVRYPIKVVEGARIILLFTSFLFFFLFL
jgi:hypothetical protein